MTLPWTRFWQGLIVAVAVAGAAAPGAVTALDLDEIKSRGKLVVGNWKMYGGLEANAGLLAELLAGWKPRPDRRIAVCVPFPYLGQARDVLAGSPIAWGAQDMSEHPPGPYTGDVAGSMIAEFGCRFVIVGHSERRHGHGESDQLVAATAKAALG